MTFDENIKVIPRIEPYNYDGPSWEAPSRSDAQKVLDTILEEAESAARKAVEELRFAIEWIGIVQPSANRDLIVRAGQLVNEIAEIRRLRQ